jgi:hypothetical protein
VGIVNRFINKVMIINMMGNRTIIAVVKVKAGMVLMEINSLSIGIMIIINTGTSKMAINRMNSKSTGDQETG